MKKQLKLFLVFLAIWIIAAFINGLLCSIILRTLETKERFFDNEERMKLTFFFSFMFGAPFVGLVGLTTMMVYNNGIRGKQLYKFTLVTAFACSILAAFFFSLTLGSGFITKYFMAGIIITSALSSIFFFRKKIKTI